MTHPHSFRLLTTALIVAVLWFGWNVGRTTPVPPLILVTVVVGATPVSADSTVSDFEPTMVAWINGTVTRTPVATAPPHPTVTPPVVCRGGLPVGTVCYAPTAVPTPTPTIAVRSAPPPLPTWPGEAMATPGVHYQMGQGDD